MRAWLIQTGEPLPIDGEFPRLLRTGFLAQQLADRGHHVTWWCSTFNHWTKAHRAWLEQLRTNAGLTAEERTVLSEYLSLLAYTEQRRDALDRQLEALVLAPAVSAAGRTTLSASHGVL